MTITPLQKIISFKDKHTVVKAMIYLDLLQREIQLPNNMLNLLALFGMYEDKNKVVEEALSKEFYQSVQTIENGISFLVNKVKLLEKDGDKIRKISIFPQDNSDAIAATIKIHNIQSK